MTGSLPRSRRAFTRRGATVLDFSLVAPGGSATHASGFLSALAASRAGADLVVCLPGDQALLRSEEEGLTRAGVRCLRLGSKHRAGSWRSRISGQVALPLLSLRLRPSVVFIPREVGPLLPVGRSVLLAANVLRWGVPPTGEDSSASQRSKARALSELKSWVARRAASRASAVVVSSGAVADLVPHPRVEVIPFGIDVPAVEVVRPPEAGRSLRVVFLGSIARHKRIDVVIELVAELRSRHAVAATLDIWGGGNQAELRAELEELVSEQLGDAGALRGPLDPNLRGEVLSEADILAVGSGVESFGFPLLEAQKSGTLVVAPDSPIVREQCGERAVTYPEGDAIAGAASLADTLSLENPEQLSARLRRGVEHASSFTWRRCVDETLELLAEIAERPVSDP